MVCFSKRKQDKGLVNLHREAQDLENLHFSVFLFHHKDLAASKTPSQFIMEGLFFLFSKQELCSDPPCST